MREMGMLDDAQQRSIMDWALRPVLGLISPYHVGSLVWDIGSRSSFCDVEDSPRLGLSRLSSVPSRVVEVEVSQNDGRPCRSFRREVIERGLPLSIQSLGVDGDNSERSIFCLDCDVAPVVDRMIVAELDTSVD